MIDMCVSRGSGIGIILRIYEIFILFISHSFSAWHIYLSYSKKEEANALLKK